MTSVMRSLLFCPASEPAKLHKAIGSEADLVVADLEDAVAEESRPHARKILRELASSRPDAFARLAIRINAAGAGYNEADLQLVEDLRPRAVLLPKATTDRLRSLSLWTLETLAIVETAEAVTQSLEIARDPRVSALVFGAIDFAAEVDVRWTPSGTHLLFARSKLAIDSAAAGIEPPIDTAFAFLQDDVGLRQDAEAAASVGFQGKCCIHPKQLAIVHEVFTQADLAWAEETLHAYELLQVEGAGVAARNGEMVDMATVRRARRIVERYGRREPA